MKTKISELFYSLQGEGPYTGTPSVFIRTFLCSLQCQGFGQAEPANPTTWIQPWKTIDIKAIESIDDLPVEVYEYGCDSVYSWNAKFKGLQVEYTTDDVIEKLKELGQYEAILRGDTHLIFTGGEPLMKNVQPFTAELITKLGKLSKEAYQDCHMNMRVTFETNGTVEMLPVLKEALSNYVHETLFSLSPKLLHVAGELPAKAIKPEAVTTYIDIPGAELIFKYVYSASKEAEQDLNDAIAAFAEIQAEMNAPIYLMPEGPNKHRVVSSRLDVAEYCMKRGFRFTDRLHTHLWDNKIGV